MLRLRLGLSVGRIDTLSAAWITLVVIVGSEGLLNRTNYAVFICCFSRVSRLVTSR